MRKRSLTVSISLFVLMLCRPVLGQDSGIVARGPSQRPHISEIMEWLDKNGLAQARVRVRTSSQPAKEEFFCASLWQKTSLLDADRH
jgi:hypothetical protein